MCLVLTKVCMQLAFCAIRCPGAYCVSSEPTTRWFLSPPPSTPHPSLPTRTPICFLFVCFRHTSYSTRPQPHKYDLIQLSPFNCCFMSLTPPRPPPPHPTPHFVSLFCFLFVFLVCSLQTLQLFNKTANR